MTTVKTPENLDLEALVKSCDPKDTLRLYAKELGEKSGWFMSKTQRDLNLKIQFSNKGFTVEFYNSTYDIKSHSKISYDQVVEGLTLLLADNRAPDDAQVSDSLRWGMSGIQPKKKLKR